MPLGCHDLEMAVQAKCTLMVAHIFPTSDLVTETASGLSWRPAEAARGSLHGIAVPDARRHIRRVTETSTGRHIRLLVIGE